MPVLPMPGMLFRHYKGQWYRVLLLARHSETGEELVVYQNTAKPELPPVARPLDSFLSPTERGGVRFTHFPYPNPPVQIPDGRQGGQEQESP